MTGRLRVAGFRSFALRAREGEGGVDIRAIYSHMARDTSHGTTWHMVYIVHHLSHITHKEKAHDCFLVLSGLVKVCTAAAKFKVPGVSWCTFQKSLAGRE